MTDSGLIVALIKCWRRSQETPGLGPARGQREEVIQSDVIIDIHSHPDEARTGHSDCDESVYSENRLFIITPQGLKCLLAYFARFSDRILRRYYGKFARIRNG